MITKSEHVTTKHQLNVKLVRGYAGQQAITGIENKTQCGNNKNSPISNYLKWIKLHHYSWWMVLTSESKNKEQNGLQK